MVNSVPSNTTPKSPRKIFRKQLILPAEHGSWSWLLVPYFVGLIVAGTWNLAAFLVLLGGLAGFLMRQPATVAMRVRAGRGRRADGRPARVWTVIFGAIALACLLGLLALGRADLLWLLIPMAGIFVLYVLASRQRRASVRSLWMELAGALGLSAMAPAAYIAATGQLDDTAWALWALMAGQNGLGVIYVRLRIADTHGRVVNRMPMVWFHGLVLLGVVAAAFLEAIPWLAVTPFAGFLVRAIWAVARVRP
ncbi:MAG: YwiC-like family protein, partial [Chloroflexota bacterium]